jgi:hypothetical protein
MISALEGCLLFCRTTSFYSRSTCIRALICCGYIQLHARCSERWFASVCLFMVFSLLVFCIVCSNFQAGPVEGSKMQLDFNRRSILYGFKNCCSSVYNSSMVKAIQATKRYGVTTTYLCTANDAADDQPFLLNLPMAVPFHFLSDCFK